MAVMRMLSLLALLLVGCVATGSKFTYAQLQAIKPGVTTRAEVLKMLGEPTQFSTGSRPDMETLSYYQISPWVTTEGYAQEYDRLSIILTNGVVQSWDKTR